MKLRAGFVSNSSTCSFQIYGISEELYDVKEKLQEEHGMPIPDDDKQVNGEYFDEGEWLEEFFSQYGLSVETIYDWDAIFIGRCWSTVGDDETGKQFKDGIKKSIEEVFGSEKAEKCETHSGEYSC